MPEDGSTPVIAGLTTGLGFIILLSLWYALAPLHTSDYIKLGNSNGLVRSFLHTFPNAYVSVEEYHINATGAKGVILYYTTSKPWNENEKYDIPVYMRVLIDAQGHSYFFIIHCQSENGVQERRVWLQEHVRLFLETAEPCQEAIRQLSRIIE